MIRVFISLLLCSMLSVNSFSQNEKLRSKIQVINPIDDQKDIFDLYFGTAALIDASIQTKGFNFVTGLNYFYELNLHSKQNISFALGLGYQYSSNSFNGTFNQQYNAVYKDYIISFSETLSIEKLKKSRLNSNLILIPLELRFRTLKLFKVYIGCDIGYQLSLNNKFELDNNKDKNRLSQDVNRFKFEPSIRVGYKDMFLFGRYQVSSTFKNSISPQINCLQFGVSLGG